MILSENIKLSKEKFFYMDRIYRQKDDNDSFHNNLIVGIELEANIDHKLFNIIVFYDSEKLEDYVLFRMMYNL